MQERGDEEKEGWGWKTAFFSFQGVGGDEEGGLL